MARRRLQDGFIVVFILAGFISPKPAWARLPWEAKKDAPAEGKAAPSVSALDSTKREAEKRAREALNGTQWEVDLTPVAGEKPKKLVKDTLRFDGGRVLSDHLNKSGFPGTNFTITIGDDGVTVWETMQTSQDASVAFWRGELHGETMRGLLSRQSAGAVSEDMFFSGKLAATRVEARPMEAVSKD